MPALSNPRHERFAQALAEGYSAQEAYTRAGYTPHRQSAHRLFTSADVQARVAQLQDIGAQRAEMTFEGHLRTLEDLRDRAIEAGQLNVAVTAEYNRGKAKGFYVDRVDTTQRTISGDAMRPEDWVGQYAQPGEDSEQPSESDGLH